MHRLASFLVLISACAGSSRFRAEHAGQGVAVVSPRGAPAAPGSTIAVGPGAYDLKLHFDVPRAQVVEWQVACPGADQQGSLGEPFEAYRTRRLAQLRAERERDAQTAGAVTSALVGAFAPSVVASGQSGPVRADAQVSGQALGAAAGTAAAASVDQNVQLDPNDVGGGPVETVVHVVTSAPGTCTVTAIADDANVPGRFELIHIRDLQGEQEARDAAIATATVHARTELATQLQVYGGDPTLRQRQRQRDAEAQARAAAEARAGAEARIRAEADLAIQRDHEAAARLRAEAELSAQREREAAANARAELELRTQTAAAERAALELRIKHERELRIAMEIRMRIRFVLIEWGADVNYRARLAAEHDARIRGQMELDARRLRIALEIRMRLRLLLIEWGADADYRLHMEQRTREAEARHAAELAAAEAERQRRQALQLDLAIHARGELRAYLVAIGARERPPMPQLRPENPGAAPFDGAAWVAGYWSWSGTEWMWVGGGWKDTSGGFGATGGDTMVAAPAVIDTPVETVSTTTVVVEPPPPTTIYVEPPRGTVVITPVRDHRHEAPPPVRDHRNEPTVRDHRTHPAPAPAVRDHRDDKPVVRDHRH